MRLVESRRNSFDDNLPHFSAGWSLDIIRHGRSREKPDWIILKPNMKPNVGISNILGRFVKPTLNWGSLFDLKGGTRGLIFSPSNGLKESRSCRQCVCVINIVIIQGLIFIYKPWHALPRGFATWRSHTVLAYDYPIALKFQSGTITRYTYITTPCFR